MPRSSCVKNCSKNAKLQTNLNFYILPLESNGFCVGCKQLVGHNSVLSFCTPSSSTAVCKGSVFLQFCVKIQSSMHQIFVEMYLTVSFGQSSFVFDAINGHSIFPHLNLPPNKSPQTGTCDFTILLPSSKTNPKDT